MHPGTLGTVLQRTMHRLLLVFLLHFLLRLGACLAGFFTSLLVASIVSAACDRVQGSLYHKHAWRASTLLALKDAKGNQMLYMILSAQMQVVEARG